jgi:hypothetical protein
MMGGQAIDWNQTRVSDYVYHESQRAFRQIQAEFERDCPSWDEADTICMLIIPMLRWLAFPSSAVRQTVDLIRPPDRSGLRADMQVRGFFGPLCMIEAKRVGADLDQQFPKGRFCSPVDQCLTYLDHYPASFSILTNGVDWRLFKALSPAESATARYAGLRFRLDRALDERDWAGRFRGFLETFHHGNLLRMASRPVAIPGHMERVVDRPGGRSHLLLADFSKTPSLSWPVSA